MSNFLCSKSNDVLREYFRSNLNKMGIDSNLLEDEKITVSIAWSIFSKLQAHDYSTAKLLADFCIQYSDKLSTELFKRIESGIFLGYFDANDIANFSFSDETTEYQTENLKNQKLQWQYGKSFADLGIDDYSTKSVSQTH
jgi:hypothetical protein